MAEDGTQRLREKSYGVIDDRCAVHSRSGLRCERDAGHAGMHKALGTAWSGAATEAATTGQLLQRAVDELKGPIHGRLVELRRLCGDEVTYEEIDQLAGEIDDQVHALVEVLEGLR